MTLSLKQVFLFFIVISLSSIRLSAQISLTDTDNSNLYFDGLELISKANYTAARSVFEQYLNLDDTDKLYVAEASYYRALSAVNLYHNDAEGLIQSFIDDYPNHPKSKLAYYDLGNFYYQQKNYKKALVYLLQFTEQKGIAIDKRSEVDFKIGYCYFTQQKFEEAAPYFSTVKKINGTFYSAANYYSGYIGYETGNYTEALKDLKNAEKSEAYRPVVPYLITNVYYKLKDYKTLIQFAEPYYKNREKVAAKNDIVLLIADAYYHLEDYKNAHTYYSEYLIESEVDNLPVELMYRIGFVAYTQGDTMSAIDNFKQVAEKDKTDLGVYASYYLGILYIGEGNLLFAVTAFDNARKRKSDPKVYEEVSYQYAKLNYDLDRIDLAIESMQDFNSRFPMSSHKNEINDLLSEAYFSSKNYDRALEYIAGLSDRSSRVLAIYQKASFFKGVDYFNKSNFSKAVDLFNQSLKHPIDKEIESNAHFWLGETHSIANNYLEAIKYYQQVLWNSSNASVKLNTRYGLGSALYNTKDYNKALSQFKVFTDDSMAKSQTNSYNDALVRLADCYYATKSYQKAIETYKMSVVPKTMNNDYANLQLGIIYGIESQYDNAMLSFDMVINSIPASKYYDDALFYKAQLNFEIGNYEQAIKGFTVLIQSKQVSKFVPYAYLKKASASFNLKQYDKSIANYEAIIDLYPTHKVAKEALLPLQEVLALTNKASDFDAYLTKYKSANPEDKSTEGVEFEAARTLYFNQEYKLAISKLKMFIENYPESGQQTLSSYYIAESYFQLNQLNEAKSVYYEIAGNFTFLQYNRVIARIAEIEQKLALYDDAIKNYRRLSAIASSNKEQANSWMGLMECYYQKGSYDSATYFANELIAKGNLNTRNQNKASLYLGKSAYKKGDYQTAQDEFLNTINNAKDEFGAEAQFLLGEMFYLQKGYNKSLEALIELNSGFSSYEHWVGEGFLLIADNYVALEELFQAKGTLNSIIDNFPDQEIVMKARVKLGNIEKLEEKFNSVENSSDTLFIGN